MTNTGWRSIMAVGSAVVTFLLVQPLVQQYPVLMLVLGCINVGLVAINVPDNAGQ